LVRVIGLNRLYGKLWPVATFGDKGGQNKKTPIQALLPQDQGVLGA